MIKMRVLIVDDEEDMLDVCRDILKKLEGVETVTECQSKQAAKRLAAEPFDLMITDIRMPGMNGVDLLRSARGHDPHLPVLMLTAFPDVETAVESMKLGALDYIRKPFLPENLLATVKRILETKRLKEENAVLARHVEQAYRFDDMIGESAPMRAVFDTIRQIAQSDTDVLVVGETGTGKELVARSIHRNSRRRDARFVPVDCGAIPEGLLESEFFGHERGAFTGAHAKSLGLLEIADGGTFFLDELAELPLLLQVKLLRALQERKIRRVGGKDEIDLDFRVVAATSHDLGAEVRAGHFREDLFYRINVIRIELPPLRERADDLRLLTSHFVSRYTRKMGKPVVDVSDEVLEIFSCYPWPGNVRELQNVLRRAITLTRHTTLMVDDLPDEVVIKATKQGPSNKDGFFQLRTQRVDSFEKEYLTTQLVECQGDVSAAARQARLPRGTFYRLMKKHGMQADDFRS